MTHSAEYVVVGGGTAGNALAVRLAEQGHSVVVLEAGKDVSTDPHVQTPGLILLNFTNSERNWMYVSTPQDKLGGRPIFLPRGRALGGTSTINFLQLTRPGSHEFNEAFDALGVDGWSWDDLLPYFRKSEKVTTKSSFDTNIIPTKDVHGSSGPVEHSAPFETTTTKPMFFKAAQELGLKLNHDANDGTNTGVFNSFQAIDSNGIRVSSYTAYLKPNLERLPNLHVISEAHVTRIIFNSDGTPVAEGVEYVQNGETRVVKASKEVILSAGSYGTPKLLELSGIGDPEILSKHGIKTIVANPGVGANLLVFELALGVETFDSLRDPSTLEEEQKKFLSGNHGKLSVVPLTYAVFPANKVFSTDEKEVYKLQLRKISEAATRPVVPKILGLHEKWLDNDDAAFLEILDLCQWYPTTNLPAPVPGKTYLSVIICLQYPASHGSTHISSNNPQENPVIDPQILSQEVDMDALVAGVNLIRKLANAKSFHGTVVEEIAPGKGGDVKEFIRRNVGVAFHPVGTAAMLPQELGGVVDKDLKVYGTRNVRVVDASVLPMEHSLHPQATIYALAEKAADIIGGRK